MVGESESTIIMNTRSQLALGSPVCAVPTLLLLYQPSAAREEELLSSAVRLLLRNGISFR